MPFFRLFCTCIMIISVLACATGPAPERAPKHMRQSLRFFNKGIDLYTKGCFSRALIRFSEAHARYAAADHLPGVAASLNAMANIAFKMNDLDHALGYYDEAMALFHRLGDADGMVRVLSNKGALLIRKGQMDDAEQLFSEADRLAENGDRLPLLRMKNRGLQLLSQERHDAAVKLLNAALRRPGASDPAQRAAVHFTLGRAYEHLGNLDAAVDQTQKALAIDRDNGAYYSIAEDLAALGSLYEKKSAYVDAVAYYKRSLKGFALLEDWSAVDAVAQSITRAANQTGEDIQTIMTWLQKVHNGADVPDICR